MNPLARIAEKLAALRYGKDAEEMAAKYLSQNGYRILEKNYRCREGEIDIVAEKTGILVFCEVKARKSLSFGTALEGVTPGKIKKIRKAAESYISRNSLHHLDCRFDVVTIDEADGAKKFDIIPNAF